ncbi:MAG: Ppx/GppA family phosphatase [Kiritimatiellae bacterium]|nr:Ppx/GppA family phosphatase [Kiritimatiellia bacterium]MDW8458719.1 Ppx/GppA phosphatase family protein [Verrucomicrobiota bacterium]
MSRAGTTSGSEHAASAARTVAVIDVGSSAIRMEIAEIAPDGAIRTLDALQQPVHLGRDTFTTGRIQSTTIEECVKILKGFRRVMEEYGVVEPANIRAVATSSVREAANRETFLDRVYMATQINVRAIDEAEETRLTYMAVQELLEQEPALKREDALVVEVGGGDTELLVIQGGFVSYSNTFRLGTLRLLETFGSQQTSPQRALAVMLKQIQLIVDQIRRSVPVERVPRLVALSGDARFAASCLVPDWTQLRYARLDPKTFAAFARKIATQSADDLVRSYRLNYAEAEVLGSALMSFAQLARAFNVDELIVPKTSLRHGLLKEIIGGGAWTKEFMEQVEHSAIALGTKYAFDERHARQVADLSVRLFRALQGEHMLPAKYELILRVAALLHEIGLFVNNRSHHKHSMYLIMNSDLFGLSHEDMLLIAMVARYHRRAAPQPYHEGYSSLSRDARLAVSKLAAILRVADALDRNHMQQVRDVRFTRENGQFIVWVRDVEDLSIERLALKEKGSLFEDIYGLSVAFRTEITAEGIAADV